MVGAIDRYKDVDGNRVVIVAANVFAVVYRRDAKGVQVAEVISAGGATVVLAAPDESFGKFLDSALEGPR